MGQMNAQDAGSHSGLGNGPCVNLGGAGGWHEPVHLLEGGGRYLPAEPPMAWAKLGEPDRAEALASAIEKPWDTTDALISLTRMAFEAGDTDRARRLAVEAWKASRRITSPSSRANKLCALARTLAEAGNVDRARGLAAGAGQVGVGAAADGGGAGVGGDQAEQHPQGGGQACYRIVTLPDDAPSGLFGRLTSADRPGA